MPGRETVWVDWWSMHQCHGCLRGHDHVPDLVKAWVCDTCGEPFVPKHWEDRYSTCQSCHYGFERQMVVIND